MKTGKKNTGFSRINKKPKAIKAVKSMVKIKKRKKGKKALTKKEVFDSIYLVDGKRSRQKDNENRRRSKRQERKD